MNYYNEIKKELVNNETYKKVKDYSKNRSDLNTYYNVGRLIVEAQGGEARAKYGNGLIKEWSKTLTNLYGKGFDYTNLSRMRQLYLTFEKVGAVSKQLTWTHYRYILSLKNESKRNYYINISLKQNLSSRQLIEKIKNNEYERLEYKEKIEIINDNNQIYIKDMIKNPILIKTKRK